MQQRMQRTIERTVETSGIGFFTGSDVIIRFLPADPNHGISFQRIDLPDTQPIPALLEYSVHRQRRTAIERDGATVEMVEHVMAALAGLQIDNCRVELNAPEPPGFDGSSLALTDLLRDAGIAEQDQPRPLCVIEDPLSAASDEGPGEITARPLSRPTLAISYELDYGPRSPIPPQNLTVEITPETFVEQLAYARTFILESEVDALRAQGYGSRTTAKDLLIFSTDGIIDNQLRAPDECVRHKILDCLGDFALIGCDLQGHFNAYRSGHRLNREIIRRLKLAQPNLNDSSGRHAA